MIEDKCQSELRNITKKRRDEGAVSEFVNSIGQVV
jgi:hypothetical protein